MNVVLVKGSPPRYSLYCIHKEIGERFTVRVKVLDEKGSLIEIRDIPGFTILQSAKERLKGMVKIKQEKGKMNYVQNPPDWICAHFEDENKLIVSNDEMLQSLKDALKERYVCFKDNSGLEDKFDLDVEYLAIHLGDDEFIDVYNKYGEICTCMSTRFASVKKTEDCLEAERLMDSSKNAIKKIHSVAVKPCLDCMGKGVDVHCVNYDNSCALNERCFEDNCSCIDQKLETHKCRECDGTGFIQVRDEED
jgi:hypothetical protein